MLSMLEVGTFTKDEQIFNKALVEFLNLDKESFYFVRFTKSGQWLFPYFEGEKNKTLIPISKFDILKQDTLQEYILKHLKEEYFKYVAKMDRLRDNFLTFFQELKNMLNNEKIRISQHFSKYSVHGSIRILYDYHLVFEETYSAEVMDNIFSSKEIYDSEKEKIVYQVDRMIENLTQSTEEMQKQKLRTLINEIVYGYGDVVRIEGESFIGCNDRFGIIPKGYFLALSSKNSNIYLELRNTVLRHKDIFEKTMWLLKNSKKDPNVEEMSLTKNDYIQVKKYVENGAYIKEYYISKENEKEIIRFINGEKSE